MESPMLYRNCAREIPDNSVFCNWCGERQIPERKKKDEILVPTPRKLPSGKWFIQLRAEGQSITETPPELCVAKAKAIRAGFLEKTSKTPAVTLSATIDNYIAARSNTLSTSTIRGYRTVQRNRFQTVMKTPIGDSEIFALTWENVDLKGNTITVRGSVVPDENNKYVQKAANKNDASQRTYRY